MKKIVLTILMLICINQFSQAQISGLLYNSKSIPQSNTMNPSFFPDKKWYLTLPNVNFNFSSPLSFNEVFRVDNRTNETYINLEKVLENIDKRNTLNLDLNVGILGFGIKTKSGFVTFSTQLKLNTQFGLPRDLLRFFADGNLDENGKGKKLTLVEEDLLNLQAYMEYAVGYSRKINEKLVVGAKLKFLQGLANVSTIGSKISLDTDPNLNSITANLDYRVRVSSMVDFSDSEVTTVFPGIGGALDLGASYKLNEKFSFSASILDIGFIRWSKNISEYMPKEGSGTVTFSGLEWEDMWSNGSFNSDFFTKLQDSVVNMLTDYKQDTNVASYLQWIPIKFNLSGTYTINDMFKVYVMYHGEKTRINYYSTATLGVNINLWNWLEIMVGNTVINGRTWFNPGVGASISLFETVQIYALCDYMSNIRLVNGKAFNFNFGLNLLF